MTAIYGGERLGNHRHFYQVLNNGFEVTASLDLENSIEQDVKALVSFGTLWVFPFVQIWYIDLPKLESLIYG